MHSEVLWGSSCGIGQSERQASRPGRLWWLRRQPWPSGDSLPTRLSRLSSEPNLLVRACNQLGQFLQHRETNLRYLALESMCTLASSEFSHEAVKAHIETVINALKASALSPLPQAGWEHWWAPGSHTLGPWVVLHSAPERLCARGHLPLGLAREQTCSKSGDQFKAKERRKVRSASLVFLVEG